MSIKTKCQGGIFAGLMLLSMMAGAAADHPLLKKAEAGDKAAMLEVGISLLQAPDKAGAAKARPLLQPLAEEGSATAQLWLGRAYRDGLGGWEKDARKSFQYFEQSAGREGLNPEAQLELGKAYMNGEGTDKNLIAAYMWTALSAGYNGSWTELAVQQRDSLQKLLTPVQLEKARELVEQLQSIYLKQP